MIQCKIKFKKHHFSAYGIFLGAQVSSTKTITFEKYKIINYLRLKANYPYTKDQF